MSAVWRWFPDFCHGLLGVLWCCWRVLGFFGASLVELFGLRLLSLDDIDDKDRTLPTTRTHNFMDRHSETSRYYGEHIEI